MAWPLFVLFAFAAEPGLVADDPSGSPAGASALMNAQQARVTVQTLTSMALDRLPRRYDGEKNWDRTKKIWAGVRFRSEGLRLSTKRRWKEVRHGLQTRYQVKFPGPESSPLPVNAKVRSVAYQDGQDDRPANWLIDYAITTPLDFTARIERWNLGIRAYSIEVSGHMDVRLQLQGTLASRPDYSEIPPAIVIDPRIIHATVHLDRLYLDRISKVGGEVAEQWGKITETVINEILIEDVNEKLPAKINRAIDRKRDELRFSASDWIAKWTSPTSQAE